MKPTLPVEHTANAMNVVGGARVRDCRDHPDFAEISTIDGKVLALLRKPDQPDTNAKP